MNIGQRVRIKLGKDGDAFGRIIETVGNDCYKVQLCDDLPHRTNVFRVYHESWLVPV